MTFKSNVPNVQIALREALVEGMRAATIGTSQLVRARLSQPGTGRMYRIGKGRKNGRNLRQKGIHVASAPGHPPAVNTNRLRASLTVRQVSGRGLSSRSIDTNVLIRETRTGVVLTFGTEVEYAPFLEFGTARMKARPFLRPVMPIVARTLPRVFSVALRRGLGGKP